MSLCLLALFGLWFQGKSTGKSPFVGIRVGLNREPQKLRRHDVTTISGCLDFNPGCFGCFCGQECLSGWFGSTWNSGGRLVLSAPAVFAFQSLCSVLAVPGRGLSVDLTQLKTDRRLGFKNLCVSGGSK